MDIQRLKRIPLLILGIVTLIIAIYGGLQRMAWDLPILNPVIPLSHGQLMIGGFLGTVIGLERAVVIKKYWSYLGPLFAGLGAVMIMLDISITTGIVMITVSSVILFLMFIHFIRDHPTLHTGVMTLGALMWLIGNILWLLGFGMANILMWWMGFLVLTILGERLELSRILKITRTKRVHFLFGITMMLLGVILATFRFEIGMKSSGFALLILALWLLLFDLSRKSLRRSGLTRFIAVALLSGFFWLAAGGIMAFFIGDQQAGPVYDAFVHAVMIGFVFSMIFGHAPIIFPAILNVTMIFRWTAYVPLILLHLSLLLRISADHAGWLEGRMWGGMINGITILLFFANTIASVQKKPA
jgi:hypothetical protein